MFHFGNFGRTLLVCLLLGLLTLGIYGPVVRHDFINLDDYDYVKENPEVTSGLTWHGASWAFRSGHSSNWHPITWLSHMLDAQLYGMNPGGHHFTNVLLHVANTMLLLIVFNQLTGKFWPSATVAALFGLHPLHVESVAWVAERKDVLSAFFFMLTLLTYSRYVESKIQNSKFKIQWYLITLLLFALGLMSKPMLVTLPCVLLLLDYWPLQRLDFSRERFSFPTLRGLVVEKAPFLVLSIVSSGVTVWAQRAGHAVISFEELPFGDRLANATSSYFGYIEKIFWPSNLAVFYPYLGTPSATRVLLAGLAITLISAVAVLRARSSPFLLTGWFWYLGTLVPVIGLVQVGGQAMADRYSYIPSIGVFVMLAWGADALIQSLIGKRVFACAMATALGVCAVLTHLQLEHWKNGKTLFEHARKATDKNYMAAIILGNLVAQEGKFDEALRFFAAAASEKADNPETHLYAGRTLEKMGRFEEAAASYTKAQELKPGYGEAHIGLGSALAHEKKFAEAIEQYTRALECKPQSWEAEAGLGLALESAERFGEALPHLRNLVALKPSNAEAHFYLAIACRETGYTNEAQQEVARALSLEPGMANRFCEAGKAMATAGDIAGAISRFKAALEIKSDQIDAHEQLGLLLAQGGQLEEAIIHFKEVLRLRPDAQAHYNLGLAYVLQSKPNEAITHYRQALELRPDWPEALNDLAWILATHRQVEIRNGVEAVRLAERACALTENKQARFLGTLDAAYAEAGRFAEAIATARKAQDIASAAGQTETAEAAQRRMNGYESKTPFRQQ